MGFTFKKLYWATRDIIGHEYQKIVWLIIYSQLTMILCYNSLTINKNFFEFEF